MRPCRTGRLGELADVELWVLLEDEGGGLGPWDGLPEPGAAAGGRNLGALRMPVAMLGGLKDAGGKLEDLGDAGGGQLQG